MINFVILRYSRREIFESWKYSFDAGKQVFRALNSNKVFEKRIVKDINGNPAWTTWVEIPDAEAHGIQAIAVNDRPLQLPNSDGAIKLQITPHMINSYTKGEIHSLIEKKIDEQVNGAYTYVKWIEGCKTAKEVLQKTYPDGGIIGTFYLVEPHAGTSGIQEIAEFFIWAENSVGKFDWILSDIPDMREFVSYSVFYEHTHDEQFHLKGDEERQKWDNVSGMVYEINENIECNVKGSIKEVDDKLIAHSNLIGPRNSPHVTEEERLHWNAAFTNSINTIPEDNQRYIALNNGYQLAFEQAKFDKEIYEKIFDSPSIFAKSGQVIIGDLLPKFNSILVEHLLVGIQLEVGNLNSQNTKIKFETRGSINNIPIISDEYSTGDFPLWKIGNKAFDEIIIVSNDEDKSFTLSNVKLYLKYRKVSSVEIGNPALPLNLIGPDRKVREPTYNGEPLFGEIANDIEATVNGRLLDLLKYKVNVVPENSSRYDVRGNTLIKSLIQTNEIIQRKILVIHRDQNILEIQENGVLYSGLVQIFKDMRESGEIPVNIDLVINHANTTGKTIYFNTDKPLIRNSPVVNDDRFDSNWPGVIDEEFDKIYVRNGSLKILSGGEKEAKIIISYIKNNDTAYVNEHRLNWRQFANEFELDVDNDILLKTNKDVKIKADNIVESANNILLKSQLIDIGKTPKNYGEAGDIIKVYGQKIDDRYASKALFENQSSNLEHKLQGEIDRSVAEDNSIIEKLNAEITRATDEDNRLEDELKIEINRSLAEDNRLSKALKEESDRIDAEIVSKTNELNFKINTEINRIDTENSRLNTKITTEVGTINTEISKVDKKIDDRAGELDAELAQKTNELNTKIDSEINRIDSEISDEKIKVETTKQELETKIVNLDNFKASKNELESIKEELIYKIDNPNAGNIDDIEGVEDIFNNFKTLEYEINTLKSLTNDNKTELLGKIQYLENDIKELIDKYDEELQLTKQELNEFKNSFPCYNIFFDANGGDQSSCPINIKTHQNTLIIPEIVPNREDYNFIGYSDNSTDTNGKFGLLSLVCLNEDITLYAIWE